MNNQKFTQKSIETLQNMSGIADEYGNQTYTQAHLLYSLLTIDESLIVRLISKMGIDAAGFTKEAERLVNSLPKVSGSSANHYMDSALERTLNNAEKEADRLGEEHERAA